MKKRLFAIMLALAMLLAAVPALAEEGEVQEQDQVKEKILCATEGCNNEVANKGDFCKDCAKKKDDMLVIADDPNQKQQSNSIKGEVQQNTVLGNSVQPDNEHVCKLSYTFNNYQDGKCVHQVTCETENCTEYPKIENCVFDTDGWSINNPNYNAEGTLKPTCEQGGKGAVKCSKCGHISYMDTAKLGHDLEQINESPATCTDPAHGNYWKCKR